MSPIWKSVAGVVAGFVAHGITVAAVEAIGHALFGALPREAVNASWEEKTRLVAALPAGALPMVLLAWVAGVVVGGFVAAWIAGRAPLVHAGIIGGLNIACIGFLTTMLPFPLWLAIGGPIGSILATLMAARLAQSLVNPGLDTRGTPTRTPAAGTPDGGASAGAA